MRFTVDTDLVAVHDTENGLYAGFSTAESAATAAELLNNNDMTVGELFWEPRQVWTHR